MSSEDREEEAVEDVDAVAATDGDAEGVPEGDAEVHVETEGEADTLPHSLVCADADAEGVAASVQVEEKETRPPVAESAAESERRGLPLALSESENDTLGEGVIFVEAVPTIETDGEGVLDGELDTRAEAERDADAVAHELSRADVDAEGVSSEDCEGDANDEGDIVITALSDAERVIEGDVDSRVDAVGADTVGAPEPVCDVLAQPDDEVLGEKDALGLAVAESERCADCVVVGSGDEEVNREREASALSVGESEAELV